MRSYPALCALAGLMLLGACSQSFQDGIPVYVGNERVTTLGAPRTNALAQVPAGAAAECEQLLRRVEDQTLTDSQRIAAANYRASLGC